MHDSDRCRRQLVLQHFHCVVTDHAQVAQHRRFSAEQQPSNARPMHFDADAVDFGMRAGEFEQRFAGAEADLKHARRRAPEQCLEIQRRLRKFDTIFWPQLLECSLLTRRRAACTQHEAAHTAQSHVRGIFVGHHVVCFWPSRCSNSSRAAEGSGVLARVHRNS